MVRLPVCRILKAVIHFKLLKICATAAMVSVLLIFAAPTLWAQDNLDDILDGFEDAQKEQTGSAISDDPIDDVLEGFDDEPEKPAVPSEASPMAKPSVFSLDGQLKLGASCNISHDAPEEDMADWRGLSRLRPELQLDLNARFSDAWQGLVSARGFYDFAYTIKGRHSFTPAVINTYEEEVEFKEVYLLGRVTRALDLKIGRQIVVWGKSDSIRVTDVLNPLDIREPGLTDIEDLRLPVTMVKADGYVGSWNLAGIAIPEIRFDKMPVYGHDFYPGAAPLPEEDKPQTSFENMEWALSLSGIFDGWDMDFYYARIFNDTPHIEQVSSGMTTKFMRKHERLHMFGAAYNRAMGNFLAKAEAAVFEGMVFSNTPGTDYVRIDMLAGVEYSGFNEATLTVEFANRHLRDHDKILEAFPDGVYEDMFQAVIRYTRDFLNDTLTVNFFGTLFGPADADGFYERLDMEYDISDTRKVRGGLVLYQSGEMLRLSDIDDNDRLFFEYVYNF